MLRQVTESLHRHLLQHFPADSPYGAGDFSQSPMPPSIAHFLRADLDEHLRTQVDHMRSEWFDFEDPQVKSAWEALLAVLPESVRFPPSEWSSALERAVRLVLSHLVTPVQTSVSFVFNDAPDEMPVDEVRRRMLFFSSYPYLREVSAGYFERKQLSEIDREQLADLLTRIDQRMVSDYKAEDWLNLLEPLFTLSAVGASAGALPVEVLKQFFAEKKQDAIVTSLTREFRPLLPADVRRLIETPAPEAGKPTSPAIKTLYQAAPRDRGPAADEPAPDESVPLWKRFHRDAQDSSDGGGAVNGGREAPVPSTAVPKPSSSDAAPLQLPADAESVPLWKRFAVTTEPAGRAAPAAPVAGLEHFEQTVLGEVSIKRRKWFVHHLFNDEQEAYEEALRALYAAGTWTHATQIIGQEIFQKYQVNIYSEPAVAFTDAVEARYRT